MPNHHRHDVCVIGAGLAGLSIAALLAERRRVILLEREPQIAYHSTGRSAALFAEAYGNAPVRALTRASRAFYFEDRGGRCFTSPRGELFVAAEAQRDALEALEAELRPGAPQLRRLSGVEAAALCPALPREGLIGGLLDPDSRDIDVAAVVDHYHRQLRAHGGELRRDAEVEAIERGAHGFTVAAGEERYEAPILVDAAGAWADRVASLAGVAPIGLQPRLRTAVRVAAGGFSIADWPCVADVEERWYFRPDAQALMLSPADETPTEPCDARPDELTVAETIERIESATRLRIDRPIATWAGLRTFAADRSPVIGYERGAPGFFWLAGQGGYGIQAAPAIAVLAAALLEERTPPAALTEQGVDAGTLDPARLRD